VGGRGCQEGVSLFSTQALVLPPFFPFPGVGGRGISSLFLFFGRPPAVFPYFLISLLSCLQTAKKDLTNCWHCAIIKLVKSFRRCLPCVALLSLFLFGVLPFLPVLLFLFCVFLCLCLWFPSISLPVVLVLFLLPAFSRGWRTPCVLVVFPFLVVGFSFAMRLRFVALFRPCPLLSWADARPFSFAKKTKKEVVPCIGILCCSLGLVKIALPCQFFICMCQSTL